MSGGLVVLGLGPGGSEHRTPAVEAALARADVLIGYAPYLARVAPRPGRKVVATDNREELERARDALDRAVAGARVAVVSSGDPGVFAMASAVMEAIDGGPASYREVEVEILPGVTAMLAAAACLGAPLGHDFCAISLSDNLKPWPTILRRLEAAAGAGFVIALYNPRSRTRPSQLDDAFRHLRLILPDTIPVASVSAAGTADERRHLSTLADARGEHADMRTIVMIGTEQSRIIERGARPPLLYAPRHA